MRTVSFIVVAGLAAGLWSQRPQVEPVAATLEITPVATTERYEVWEAGARTGCAITLDVVGADAMPLNAEGADCVSLPGALAGAVRARRTAGGAMVFEDSNGTTLAEFSVADGVAWQSVSPLMPPLSLSYAE